MLATTSTPCAYIGSFPEEPITNHDGFVEQLNDRFVWQLIIAPSLTNKNGSIVRRNDIRLHRRERHNSFCNQYFWRWCVHMYWSFGREVKSYRYASSSCPLYRYLMIFQGWPPTLMSCGHWKRIFKHITLRFLLPSSASHGICATGFYHVCPQDMYDLQRWLLSRPFPNILKGNDVGHQQGVHRA